ncbi:hypothetical protein [Pontibacillus yanchengensis]|nr:hypothetical protein [Pontibacillus yanchengensis]
MKTWIRDNFGGGEMDDFVSLMKEKTCPARARHIGFFADRIDHAA